MAGSSDLGHRFPFFPLREHRLTLTPDAAPSGLPWPVPPSCPPAPVLRPGSPRVPCSPLPAPQKKPEPFTLALEALHDETLA